MTVTGSRHLLITIRLQTRTAPVTAENGLSQKFDPEAEGLLRRLTRKRNPATTIAIVVRQLHFKN